MEAANAEEEVCRAAKCRSAYLVKVKNSRQIYHLCAHYSDCVRQFERRCPFQHIQKHPVVIGKQHAWTFHETISRRLSQVFSYKDIKWHFFNNVGVPTRIGLDFPTGSRFPNSSSSMLVSCSQRPHFWKVANKVPVYQATCFQHIYVRMRAEQVRLRK